MVTTANNDLGLDLSRALRIRRRRAGMTLVEIMVVVIIMAMIATAVGIAVLPQIDKANKRQTKTDSVAIASASTLWIADHAGECPTVQDLIDDGALDRAKRTTDAWDRAFTIECEGDTIVVKSSGKDGQAGTEDDVSNLSGGD